MRQILENPSVYHAYQTLGGFHSGRRKALHQYIDFTNVKRLYDIGCGPGHTIDHVPSHIEYIGFDTDDRYIEFANKRFGRRGKFFAQHFDSHTAERFGHPDLIIMNGVLHHMDDATATTVLRDALSVLTPDGVFYALDPCLVAGQNAIARRLIDGDRGQFVRDKPGYEALIQSVFPRSEVLVRHDLSWVPYTVSITRGWKQRLS